MLKSICINSIIRQDKISFYRFIFFFFFFFFFFFRQRHGGVRSVHFCG